MKVAIALVLRVLNGSSSRLRNVFYRILGVEITGYVWLRNVSIPRQWEDICLNGNVALDDGVTLLVSGAPRKGKLTIQKDVYINRNTMFDISEGVEVGEDTMIGPFCYITDHDHGFGSGVIVKNQPLVGSPVVIGRNVWIGAGVIILKGVKIGNNAVIGAGAVVTKSVADGETVAGVPARSLK